MIIMNSFYQPKYIFLNV